MRKTIICLLMLCLTLANTSISYGSQEIQEDLSLSQAISLALNASSKIKINEMQLKNIEKGLDEVSSLVRYTPTEYAFNQPGDHNVYLNYYKADYNYKSLEKRINEDKKTLAVDVINAYYNVISSKKQVDSAEVTVRKGEKDLRIARLKYELGMIALAEYLAAEGSLLNDKALLKENQNKLDEAWNKLNVLLGTKQSNRYNLTENILNNQTINVNPDEEVQKALNNSYDVWNAERYLQMNKQIQLFEKYSEIANRNIEMSNLTVSDTKQQIEHVTRSLCGSIYSLEKRYKQLEKQSSHLVEVLRVMRLQNSLGMVSNEKVLEIEANLLKVEASTIDVYKMYLVAVGNLERLTGSKYISKKCLALH